MKGGRFSEEQIIGILREHEAGAKAPDICRRHGISDGTFYKWKAKYGGLEVSEARRLKSLEDENRRLKKLLAEAMLDNAALKTCSEKTAEACGATPRGEPADRAARVESTTRLQAGGDRSFDMALSAQARGRFCTASAPARAGAGAAPLRLPAVGLAVGPRRTCDE